MLLCPMDTSLVEITVTIAFVPCAVSKAVSTIITAFAQGAKNQEVSTRAIACARRVKRVVGNTTATVSARCVRSEGKGLPADPLTNPMMPDRYISSNHVKSIVDIDCALYPCRAHRLSTLLRALRHLKPDMLRITLSWYRRSSSVLNVLREEE